MDQKMLNAQTHHYGHLVVLRLHVGGGLAWHLHIAL